MKPIKSILLDDEQDSLSAIKEQIKLYCPRVKILGTFDDPKKGLAAILQLQPDIVFLDIQMPGMNGLEVARSINLTNVFVIFVTAYSQYAINAIRLSALDYLLKPIDSKELIAAVGKVEQKINNEQSQNLRGVAVLDHLLLEAQNQSFSQETIMGLADDKGINYFKISDIIRLEANRNYCNFYFLNGTKQIVSKNIGTYIEGLKQYNLVQVHRAHVVNLNHIKRYVRLNGPFLKMCDGSEIPVSKSYWSV